MDIVFTFIDAPVPSGQIRALDAGRLNSALHDLSIRLGREHAGVQGPGRGGRSLEELCEVRLVALRTGSTELAYAVGPPDLLDLEIAELAWQEEGIHRIVCAIASDVRPEALSDHVSESVADLTEAIRLIAPRSRVRVGQSTTVHVESVALHRETWTNGSRRRATEELVTLVGRLERVDLRTHEFRLRDDLGTALDLLSVENDDELGHLVGTTVAATGRAILGRRDTVVGVERPSLEPYEPGSGIRRPADGDVMSLAAAVAGPDPLGGPQLDEADFAEFLRTIGR